MIMPLELGLLYVHLPHGVVLLELSLVFSELGLHVLPHVDEAAFNDIELSLLLRDEPTPLAGVLLEEVTHFFLVLLGEERAPQQKLLPRGLGLDETLALLPLFQLLLDDLSVLVVAVVAEDFDLALHVQNLGAVVDALAGLLLLDLLTEHLNLVLLPLLQLHLKECGLVLEVRHDDAVPLRQELLHFEHVSLFEGGHLLVMVLKQGFALTMFLHDFELSEAFPGGLSLVELTLTLADLPVLVKYL